MATAARLFFNVVSASYFLLCLSACTPSDPRTKEPKIFADNIDLVISDALPWLLAQQQENGAFIAHDFLAVRVTAIAVDMLIAPPHALARKDPRLQKAIAFLLGKQQANGSFQCSSVRADSEGTDTAWTLLALSRAKAGSSEQITKAQQFLFTLQNTDSQSLWDGGIGRNPTFDGHENLGDTSIAIQGLRASGVPANDPHLQRALAFISRCQDLSSIHNSLPWVKNSGGAVPTPDQSAAKPYGSMTCLLITDYLLLGLPLEDQRLVRALHWIAENRVAKNSKIVGHPGLPQDGLENDGLFFFYAVMSTMCEMLDQGVQVTTLTLAPGGPDISRFNRSFQMYYTLYCASFYVKLADGRTMATWLNSDTSGEERFPQIATVYALKALKSSYRPSWPE